MNWLHALRHLNSRQIAVLHVPMTARYHRAAGSIHYLLRFSVLLGVREHDELPPAQAVEVATWAPSPSGAGHGLYACFRLYLSEGLPVMAVLFAYYDGTERSPGFKNAATAGAYAKQQGFNHEADDHAH